MEENIQEKSNEPIAENMKNKKAEIEKTDSVETDETVTEHTEENNEDLHSENENENDKLDSECSEQSGTDTDDADVVLEREEGDGQEQENTPNRKVDDDEDKRNPQYIPKRGTFYEHDDRTAVDEEGEEGETPENERSDKDNSKKKVWSEKESSKWSHDRFNDQEQMPKSRAELVAIYGYDIRNEEGPPRARRRRRYGRGPNKYTRNWEDEEAYSKPTNVTAKPVVRKPRRTKDGEEFPPLVDPEISDSKSPEPESQAGGDDQPDHIEDTAPVKPETGSGDSLTHQENIAHIAKRLPRKEEPYTNNLNPNVRGVTKTRGFFKNGVRNSETRVRNQNQKNQAKHDEDDYIVSQNFTNKAHSHGPPGVQKLEKDMANMSLHQEFSGSGGRGGGRGGVRQTSVPPRLQGEQRGSKRYSSLRQRSLPETANPQYGQHPQFYQGSEFAPDYNNQPPPPPPPTNAPLLPHPPTTVPVAVPLNGAPHVLQASFAGPYPQHPPPPPAAFLQPVPPPVPQPYPPPPPQIINFAQPPPAAYPQATYSNYQQFTPVNQGQPPELYQPQGGITYYSTQNQQLLPRVPQRRVKAAIPIVPPPEHKEPRGRGRLSHGEDSPVGSAQEESPTHDPSLMSAAPMIVQQ